MNKSLQNDNDFLIMYLHWAESNHIEQ